MQIQTRNLCIEFKAALKDDMTLSIQNCLYSVSFIDMFLLVHVVGFNYYNNIRVIKLTSAKCRV